MNLEKEIKAECIVLDICEKTVKDAFERILVYLQQEGFENLNSLLNTQLMLFFQDNTLAIEYFDANKKGFYIFIFKESLIAGNIDYCVPISPKTKIHIIVVGINAKHDYNMCRWPTIGRCLKDKDSLRKIFSFKTKQETAEYINSFALALRGTK